MISDFDSATGLPISSVISVASSSARSVSSSNAFQSIPARSFGAEPAHSFWVSTAASSAAMASSGVPSATSQMRLLGGGVDHLERSAARGVAPLTSDEELLLDLLHDGLFLGGNAHVATVSVPSSSEIATSIE